MNDRRRRHFGQEASPHRQLECDWQGNVAVSAFWLKLLADITFYHMKVYISNALDAFAFARGSHWRR